MLKKAESSKNLEVWVFYCFGGEIVLVSFLFIEKNISFPQEAFVDLAAPVYRFFILQLLEIYCNHYF